MAQNDDVFIGGLVEQQGRNRQERIKPSSGLVNGFRNKVRRELGFKQVFVLKGIVMLGKGHGARIEPAVDDFGHPLHLLAALRTFDGHRVHIGPVQLDVVGAIVGHFLQFRNAADGVAVSALALPDV